MSFLRLTKTLLHPKKALKDLMANVGTKIHQFMMACNLGKIFKVDKTSNPVFKIDKTSNPDLCGEYSPRVSVSPPGESNHADHTPAGIHSPKSVPPVFCPLPSEHSTDSSGADDTEDEKEGEEEEEEEEEKESHVLDYIVTFPDSDSESGADELSKVPEGCLCPDQEYTVTFPDSSDSESECNVEEEEVFVHKDYGFSSDNGDDHQFHFVMPRQEEDMYAHQHYGYQCHHQDYHGCRHHQDYHGCHHHQDEDYGHQYYGWTGFYHVRQPPFGYTRIFFRY